MLTNVLRKVLPSYGYDTSRELVLKAMEASKFTPDISKLEEYSWQLYFATDETKKDHFKHNLLGVDAQYRFPAFTQGSFTYWDPKIPFLSPVAMKEIPSRIDIPNLPPNAKIKGQVYLIRPQRFLELDRYKQNTVEYKRERIKLIVPYRQVEFLKDHNLDPAFGVQELFCRSDYEGSSITTSGETTCIIRAWMYIGRPEFFNPLLTAFDYGPVEFHYSNKRRWCEKYYHIRRPALQK